MTQTKPVPVVAYELKDISKSSCNKCWGKGSVRMWYGEHLTQEICACVPKQYAKRVAKDIQKLPCPHCSRIGSKCKHRHETFDKFFKHLMTVLAHQMAEEQDCELSTARASLESQGELQLLQGVENV